ncbi:MAG: phage head closure protein [Deltaproteobacteria bacterium]|nr:phage head closure protein [Deltaproteobacteria bacterium]
MTCVGKLNKRITFQEITETPDTGGGSSTAWGSISTNPTVWCMIKNFSGIKNPTGRDRFMHDKVQNELTYSFTIRARTDITAGMRISYGGDFYNIRTVLENESNGAYMEIFGEKGVAT